MSRIARTAAALLMLFVTGSAFRDAPAPAPDHAPWSEEQTALVEWATDRFDSAGLDLPDIDFVFHDSLMACDGHVGLYHASRRLLEMCRLDLRTALHELAHAWANAELDDETRHAFMASRGLDVWHDADTAWEQRATEHAAEIVAWALLDRNRLVKWVEPQADGTDEVTWRLLTLPESDVDGLIDGYRLLTGLEPAWRIADDPRSIASTRTTAETVVRSTGA